MSGMNDIVGKCPACGTAIHGYHIFRKCTKCDAPLPESILAALRAAGSIDAAPAIRVSASRTNPFVTRYRDAYRIANTVNSIGSAVKGIGALLGIFIALASLSADGVFKLFGILLGLTIAAVLLCVGILVSAMAQMNQATLDVAVYESPFMTEDEKASALNMRPPVHESPAPQAGHATNSAQSA